MSPRDKGVAYPWGPHAHIPSKNLYLFFLRSWRPCEVEEVKKQCFISNLPISGSQKSLSLDYTVIKSWKNVRLKCINMSWRTLYLRVHEMLVRIPQSHPIPKEKEKGVYIRVRPRFFDQVGHQTTNAFIEDKHFFH